MYQASTTFSLNLLFGVPMISLIIDFFHVLSSFLNNLLVQIDYYWNLYFHTNFYILFCNIFAFFSQSNFYKYIYNFSRMDMSCFQIEIFDFPVGPFIYTARHVICQQIQFFPKILALLFIIWNKKTFPSEKSFLGVNHWNYRNIHQYKCSSVLFKLFIKPYLLGWPVFANFLLTRTTSLLKLVAISFVHFNSPRR